MTRNGTAAVRPLPGPLLTTAPTRFRSETACATAVTPFVHGATRKTEPGSTGGKRCPCLFQIRPPRTGGWLPAGFECAAAAAAAAVEEEENEGDDDISRNSLT